MPSSSCPHLFRSDSRLSRGAIRLAVCDLLSAGAKSHRITVEFQCVRVIVQHRIPHSGTFVYLLLWVGYTDFNFSVLESWETPTKMASFCTYVVIVSCDFTSCCCSRGQNIKDQQSGGVSGGRVSSKQGNQNMQHGVRHLGGNTPCAKVLETCLRLKTG